MQKAWLAGSGIFIINCLKKASIAWSSRSSTAISQVIHVSIWLRKWFWCAFKHLAFAFAWEFVSNLYIYKTKIH